MFSSYKDALLLGKAVEVPVKPKLPAKKTYPVYSTGEIKKMCIWGRINDLKLVNPAYFTEPNVNLLVNLMKEKINEIEVWKMEDQNQYDDIQNDFDERIEGINKCMEWVNKFVVVTDNTKSSELLSTN